MSKLHTATKAGTKKAEPKRGLFIDGTEQKIAERETFPIVSPATGEVIAHATQATEADIQSAVESARRAFNHPDWENLSEREHGPSWSLSSATN